MIAQSYHHIVRLSHKINFKDFILMPYYYGRSCIYDSVICLKTDTPIVTCIVISVLWGEDCVKLNTVSGIRC